MNPNIARFLLDAGFINADGHWLVIPALSQPEHLQKFAELIVRECSTLAYDGPGGILEHFGLK